MDSRILGLCVSSKAQSHGEKGRHYARHGKGVLQRWRFCKGSIFDIFTMREALFDGDVVEEKSAIAFAVWWPLLSGGRGDSMRVMMVLREGDARRICDEDDEGARLWRRRCASALGSFDDGVMIQCCEEDARAWCGWLDGGGEAMEVGRVRRRTGGSREGLRHYMFTLGSEIDCDISNQNASSRE
ncbi:uncharacterized protein LOC111242388 [Vigna radiata var. radiata]|uniref:Uncharacterized protein LOC111242388 n=1 Tax=Vigna radiata var. radiata TaxID=3916 RepID=A0A3Q0FB42_VIGRR|nr:uncharacterized protein LOC111242388 [Vigna radiata var. radiata]